MKILVTGGSGYIGRNLIKKLISNNLEVFTIIRKPVDVNYASYFENVITHEFVSYNLLESFIIQQDFDLVVHLAAAQNYGDGIDDISELISSNVIFGTQILSALSKARYKNFINIGTYWQHYNNELYNPVNLYAATKQAFQDILKFYVEARDIRIITLKFFDIYGPNDDRNKILYHILNGFKNNELIKLSNGDQLIDLVHIEDVIGAILMSIERLFGLSSNKYEEFAVSSQNPITLRELVGLVNYLVEGKLKLDFGAVDYREREFFEIWRDFNLLPNWKPSITLIQGIAHLLD